MKLPTPQQSAPAGGIYRAVKTAQVLGKSTDSALSRRLKLSDALGKFRSAAGK